MSGEMHEQRENNSHFSRMLQAEGARELCVCKRGSHNKKIWPITY